MIKNIYNLSVERSTKEEIEVIVNKFQSSGWELEGSWNLADAHLYNFYLRQ